MQQAVCDVMRPTWLVFLRWLECVTVGGRTVSIMRRFWIAIATTSLISTAAQAGHSHGSRADAATACAPGVHGGACDNGATSGDNSSNSSNSWKPNSFNYSLTDNETKPQKKKYDYDSIPAFPPGSPGAADKVWKENSAPAVPNSGNSPHDPP